MNGSKFVELKPGVILIFFYRTIWYVYKHKSEWSQNSGLFTFREISC